MKYAESFKLKDQLIFLFTYFRLGNKHKLNKVIIVYCIVTLGGVRDEKVCAKN